MVIDETMKMVMDDKAIEAIVSMLMELQDRENVNLPLYEQQLKETDSAIQNMLNAIQQGILTKSTKERLEELERQQEELKVKIDCEKLAKPKISAEFMTFWLQRFRKLDISQPAHRKMLIDTFINAIFLYDDKLVITYNYKDGTDTISFSDLKAAETQGNTGSDLDCFGAPKGKGHPLGGLFLLTCIPGRGDSKRAPMARERSEQRHRERRAGGTSRQREENPPWSTIVVAHSLRRSSSQNRTRSAEVRFCSVQIGSKSLNRLHQKEKDLPSGGLFVFQTGA